MSAFVEAFDAAAHKHADVTAFSNSAGQALTYGQLFDASNSLAQFLRTLPSDVLAPGAPLAVYGHKSPLMVAGFLAAAKSGHAYVPLDTALPEERIASILSQLDQPVLLDTTGTFAPQAHDLASRTVDLTDENGPCGARTCAAAQPDDGSTLLRGDDTFYILFTSGSTGLPKGVEVSAANVDALWKWLRDEFPRTEHRVFFNRVPFTFDVSVIDLVLGLTEGDTLFAFESDVEQEFKSLFDALGSSMLDFWISTPSFLEMCLTDPSFDATLLPRVRTFFVAGEVLRNETVRLVHKRFPQAKVVNGYGPTESTVVVTIAEITPAMVLDDEALPIGRSMPGLQAVLLDHETLEPVPAGASGELFLVGSTVAKGYYKRPDVTHDAFESYPYDVPEGMRSYRTGDKCFYGVDGMLYYQGRYDFQVKLHGNRIELGDIETHLCALPQVRQTCILPVEKNGAISYLQAFCQLEEGVEATFSTTQTIKSLLSQRLPAYMIPRSFKYVDAFPTNINGKIDRKALAESLPERN